MLVYDFIIQSGSEQDAIDATFGLDWMECEATEQEIGFKNYVDTANGIEIYYDFGADYYFFSPSCGE